MLACPALGLRAAGARARHAAVPRHRHASVRACAASQPASDISVEEMLTYEFGVINRDRRRELLRKTPFAAAPSAAALRAQLVMLRTLLAVTDEDFSCILCACAVSETCALLELGPRGVAERMAQVCFALPPGSNVGKIVGAAPSLLLHEDPGKRVSRALEALQELGASPKELAVQRPGSFGEVVVAFCCGNYELSPLLRAWVLGTRK
jgi:hypothetical protein